MTRSLWERLITVAVLCAPRVAWAQATLDPDLDYPFGKASLWQIVTRSFAYFGIFFIVVAAAIFIGIGAFFYFASAGNAAMAQRGKEYVERSIFGLILGLLAWVILNTIHPQFVQLPGI